MAVVLAVVAVVAIIGVILASQMNQPDGQDMSPATLDSFQITRAQEGHCVPFVSGTVRQTGNILWYGNLKSVEQTEDAGGKGGGGDDITTGYKYYMDVWQAICLGPAELISLFINDKDKTLASLGTYDFNDGHNDTTYPTQPGDYANKLRGVSHIFLNQYYLGENVSSVPTMHWVVKSTSTAPLTYANMTGGTNPAAVIFDLLSLGGATLDDFNMTSFQNAADYFNAKGYAVNMTFSKQKEVREHINDVLNYIEAGFDIDPEGKFTLTPFDPQDSSAFTVEKDDFIKFQFTRRAWKDTYNDFRANYTDAGLNYTQRTLRTKNPANKQMVGYDRQKTVDLTAFTDPIIASKRLWEIMQRMSYPESQIRCTLLYKYIKWPVGTVFTVNHEDYGISGQQYRIVGKDVGEVDSQEIKIAAVQMVEKLANANYQSSGGNVWIPQNTDPLAFYRERVFELPYNSIHGRDPAFLLLGARRGIETSYPVLVSYTGSDYTTMMTAQQMSQYGTLDEAYPNIGSTSIAIDDEKGILYTPYREDPIFESVSRTDLFTANRVAIIGDEMMAFQTVTPEGPNSIRLKGVIRGLAGTPISSHSSGSVIWLTKVTSNILPEITASSFYVKMLPSTGGSTIDPSDATAIAVTATGKARKPAVVTAIKAVRTGTTVVVTWYPTTQVYSGAGALDSGGQVDQDPMLYAGDYWFETDVGVTHDQWVDGTTLTIVQSGVFNIDITPRVDGVLGTQVRCAVQSADGTYIGPTGTY